MEETAPFSPELVTPLSSLATPVVSDAWGGDSTQLQAGKVFICVCQC